MNRLDDAIDSYHLARRLNPKRAATYHNLGVAYIDKKEYSRAIHELKRAIELQPNLADPYVNLGLAYFLHDDVDQAVSNLKHSIALEPENARAHNYLGNVYLRIGKQTEGEEELRLSEELKEAQRPPSKKMKGKH